MWWRGRRDRNSGSAANFSTSDRRSEVRQIQEHLAAFIRTRVGVEAFLEPPTRFSPPTVVLVARDGEWTRRRVPDLKMVRDLADDLALPVYDVNLVGYPARMRSWTTQARSDGVR